MILLMSKMKDLMRPIAHNRHHGVPFPHIVGVGPISDVHLVLGPDGILKGISEGHFEGYVDCCGLKHGETGPWDVQSLVKRVSIPGGLVDEKVPYRELRVEP